MTRSGSPQTGGEGIRVLGSDEGVLDQLPAPRLDRTGHAGGVAVRLQAGEPDFFAVLVDYRQWGRAALYVPEAGGALAYVEILGERGAALAVAAGEAGAEALLAGGDGRLWRYEMRARTSG